MPHLEQSTENKASVNAYASLLKMKVTDLPKISFTIENLHASNVLKWKVLATNDPKGLQGWATVKAEATLAGTVVSNYEPTAPYVWFDVQFAANVADSQANANCYGYAVRDG